MTVYFGHLPITSDKIPPKTKTKQQENSEPVLCFDVLNKLRSARDRLKKCVAFGFALIILLWNGMIKFGRVRYAKVWLLYSKFNLFSRKGLGGFC